MSFALLLLALLAFPCAARSPEAALSAKVAKEFARLEALASVSPVARRLFAATRHVPRREVRGAEQLDAIGVRGGTKPEIVFDALRLPRTGEADAELLLVLNSARASLAFPIPIVEAEQNAWQKTLQFAAERGAEDPAVFGAFLVKAVRDAGARSDALDRSDKAVVLVTSDLPELLGMSDRIVMLREGRPAGAFARAEATPERLMAAATAGSA